eukprot:scaffold171249_cov19-Prasinocladus_malaysianus.AAC.1
MINCPGWALFTAQPCCSGALFWGFLCGQAIQQITRHFELETDMDGLVRAEVPPHSLVRVQTVADGEFEDEEMVEDMEISDQAGHIA